MTSLPSILYECEDTKYFKKESSVEQVSESRCERGGVSRLPSRNNPRPIFQNARKVTSRWCIPGRVDSAKNNMYTTIYEFVQLVIKFAPFFQCYSIFGVLFFTGDPKTKFLLLFLSAVPPSVRQKKTSPDFAPVRPSAVRPPTSQVISLRPTKRNFP